MVLDLHWLAAGPPFPPAHRQQPNCSFFFASTLITGSPDA
uniref:Uncharacterized protein n=1 Tax=Nonomuraea gerenzanensis TaxID=93944 RepID=A0A1M4EQG7_9ACTN|nr:hypothetical protein BN4615_P10596 [Nonomuraea gerenzanensis]